MKIARLILALALAVTPAVVMGQGKKEAPKGDVKGKAGAMKGEQCVAKTKDGDQCKRKAAAGSKFCWQHAGKKK